MNTQLTIVAVLLCVGLMALPSSAAVGTFFHLSDWHFDPFYNENFNSDTFCRNETELNDLTGIPIFPASLASNSIHNKDFDHRLKNSPPPHFQFGQFDCDSPLPLLEAALSSMVSVDANPTFIIFTGDMSAHHLKLPERRSSAISLGSLHIREAFPNTPIFPSIGNNDCYPDYFLDLPVINRPNEWLVNLWNIWSTYFSIPSSQKKDFTHGGYYVANITQSHILLSLNTIWYSTGHDPAFNTTQIPDPAGQFAWLSAQLTAARTASLGVYIIGHILPTTGEWEEAYLDTYLSIVSQFSDVITGQLFGHTHRDAWARLNDPVSKQLVGSYLVAPSLTPKNSNNPTFRHVFYNTTTAQLLDYDQYYADLMNATLTGLLKFPREYNYQKVYQESSLDTLSIASVINKVSNDLVLFNIWNANNDAQYNTKRADNLCAMYFVTEAEQNACIDQLEVYKA